MATWERIPRTVYIRFRQNDPERDLAILTLLVDDEDKVVRKNDHLFIKGSGGALTIVPYSSFQYAQITVNELAE